MLAVGLRTLNGRQTKCLVVSFNCVSEPIYLNFLESLTSGGFLERHTWSSSNLGRKTVNVILFSLGEYIKKQLMSTEKREVSFCVVSWLGSGSVP